MKIIQENNSFFKYALEFEFDPDVLNFCRNSKDIFGWKEFNYIDGKWRFNDLNIAVEIQNKYPKCIVSDEIVTDLVFAKMKMDEEREREKNAERIKNSNESNIVINGLRSDKPGELYPYQKVGVEFFLNSGGRAILADQMGTGKTLQSLAYIAHSKAPRALIICPAAVKHSWDGEVEAWTNLKSVVINSKSNGKIFENDYYDVVIINYDIVPKFLKEILKANFYTIVVDEFTYIKNSRAKRTKCVRAICKKAPTVLLLSGTPMLSRPVELFNGLNIIDPKTWNDYIGYTKMYCSGHQGRWGWDANGASNLDELQKRISKYFIRRTKDQILKDLPEKIFINRPVELEGEYQRKYMMALDEFGRFLRDVKKKKTPEIARALQAEKLVKLGALRQLTSEGKISFAEDLINEILESDEKMLVFSVYNKPLEILYEKFKEKSVILTGKTNEKDKFDAIDKFQKDDSIKIFFGGTLSAGMGITLTAATNVLFIDYSWNPSQMSQAIDRIHRIGNKASSVNIYNLYARGTIDEYMTKLLKKKQLLFDKIIDGADVKVKSSNANMLNDVLRMVERNIKKE